MFLSFCGKNPRNEGAAFVAPNATVQGDVILKPGSTVWYGAVLRGDDGTLTLGENSNVQDNAGMHATLLNHCVVGKNCIIGAGALVPEGMVIPDGSVAVGVPARVIKPVTEAQIEANLRNAEHYVEHGKVHARELKITAD